MEAVAIFMAAPLPSILTPSLTSLDSTAKRILGAEILNLVCQRCDGTGKYLRYGPHDWFRRGNGKEQPQIPCDHVTVDYHLSYTELFPAFDSDINAAITLATHLDSLGWDFEATREYKMVCYHVRFKKGLEWHDGNAPTLALAILNAALLAAGKAV